MSNGIVDNLLQGGTPPIFGPGPGGGDLPNPRDIPEIIIKDQAAQQLGNIFDNAGITAINPNMVVDLADAVIDDELSLNEAFNIGIDSTIAGGINKAAYGIPVFGQAKGAFDTIKQIEAILGRPLLPVEISQFASGIFNFPNVITNKILGLRRGFGQEEDTTGGGIVTLGAEQPNVVVNNDGTTTYTGGTADTSDDIIVSNLPAQRPGPQENFPTGGGTVVIGGQPGGQPSTSPVQEAERIRNVMEARKKGANIGFNAGGLASLSRYLKGR
jgi:hypothetical protein